MARFNKISRRLAKLTQTELIRSELTVGGREVPYEFLYIRRSNVRGATVTGGKLQLSIEVDNAVVSENGHIYLIDPM